MSGWKQGDLYESLGRDLENLQGKYEALQKYTATLQAALERQLNKNTVLSTKAAQHRRRAMALEGELERLQTQAQPTKYEYEPSPRNRRPVVVRAPLTVGTQPPILPKRDRWVFSGPGAVELGCAQDPDQDAALCLFWRRKRGAHAPAPPHRRERVLRYVDPVWPDWQALEDQLEAARNEVAMLGGALELLDQELAERNQERAGFVGRQLRLELELDAYRTWNDAGLLERQRLRLEHVHQRELAKAREAQQLAEHRALAAEEEARLLLANPVYYQRRRGGP